jgi:hypothetical protein
LTLIYHLVSGCSAFGHVTLPACITSSSARHRRERILRAHLISVFLLYVYPRANINTPRYRLSEQARLIISRPSLSMGIMPQNNHHTYLQHTSVLQTSDLSLTRSQCADTLGVSRLSRLHQYLRDVSKVGATSPLTTLTIVDICLDVLRC